MRIIGPVICLIILLCSCKKEIHPDHPQAKKRNLNLKQQISTISIPVEVNKQSVQNAVNENLQGIIYHDDDYENNGGDDLKLKVTKTAPIELQFSKTNIDYDVPVHVWTKLRKVILFQELSKAIEFDMIIKFRTTYEINESWRLVTKTRLISFEITKNPFISFAGYHISIKPIVEQVLKEFLPVAAEAIDDDLKQTFNIQNIIREMNEQFSQPIDLLEDGTTWLTVRPMVYYLSSIDVSSSKIKLNIGIDAYMQLFFGNKPLQIKNRTPVLKQVNFLSSGIDVDMLTEISFSQMSDLINENFSGFKYQQGKRTIVIDSVSTFPDREKIGLKLNFTGSIEGELFLSGLPKYDSLTKEVYLSNLHFDIESKKAALKVAQWLVNGPFQKKVERNMRFSIEDYLAELNDELKEQFESEPIFENTFLDLQIKDLTIRKVQVDGNKIIGYVGVSGRSRVLYK